MKQLMLVAAVAAGFGFITEQSVAAPHDRGRSHANHRGAQSAPARTHAGHRHAAPARRHVAPRVAAHVHRPVVVPVRRPVIGPRFVPGIRHHHHHHGTAVVGVTPVYDSITVAYQVIGVRTISQLSYAAAVDLAYELRALGAYAELRNGYGGYEVVYSMSGSQARTFGSRSAAIDFETRLAQLGMQIL